MTFKEYLSDLKKKEIDLKKKDLQKRIDAQKVGDLAIKTYAYVATHENQYNFMGPEAKGHFLTKLIGVCELMQP